ncbi:holo-ACP synthase [Acrocarpospora sp. B8E8]|uniref:holo-ACP synthase n=1 Tax=Acrocarpospora sp. B8E8 TaxID=3153572 RepID=UPI00325E298E
MIIGIGVDLVDVARFAATIERTPGLLTRLFTADEQAEPVHSLAARFAAKEAVAKALGAPAGLSHLDAEVRKDPEGRPSLHVGGRAGELADSLGVRSWHVSLSHDGGFALAFVIAER